MKDILIDIKESKEPYYKTITDDKIINVTGQSGSGKSTYIKENFKTEEYLILDTDEILSEERFNKTTGINKVFGEYLRSKYNKLPDLANDFDLVYKEILEYCSKYNKTIVIDCAQFHCIKDISLLKGKIIILRTDIDTCYKRCIERFKKSKPNYTEEELEKYKNRKKSLYSWYEYSNKFIEKIDLL